MCARGRCQNPPVQAHRRHGFGHADERPYRRLTGDAVRLALALLLVALTSIRAGRVSGSQHALDAFFAGLPNAIDGAFRAVFAVGSLWGVGLILGAAIAARRFRLAAILAGSGVLAWWIARTAGFMNEGHGLFAALGKAFGAADAGPYPAVRLAVLTAVVVTAAPFLSRPTRRLGQVLLYLLVPGAVIIGAADTNAAIAGVAIGWGIAAALHLAFGSPAGRPTRAHIGSALGELGAPVPEVALAEHQPRGSTLATGRLEDGREISVRVYGRDAADTQLVAKVWRSVVYKDSGPTWTITRLQQVEHEALCLYAAREAGVAVPEIVAAGVAGPSAALLAYARPSGVGLRDLPEGAGTAWAGAFWATAGRMWEARITHGALDPDHLVVDASAPGAAVTIVDFDRGQISASADAIAQDRAQALVTTALVTGVGPAVETAAGAVDADGLRAISRYLTKPALTSTSRQALRAQKDVLDELTKAVAERSEGVVIRPVELRRVSPMKLLTIGALLFALWIILGQVGSLSDLWDTLKTADWPWLVLGFFLAHTQRPHGARQIEHRAAPLERQASRDLRRPRFGGHRHAGVERVGALDPGTELCLQSVQPRAGEHP